MIEFVVVTLLSASCVGAGAAVLRALGLCDDLPRRELLVTCVGRGLGVTGWVGCFFALNSNLQASGLTVLCAFGVPGLLFLKRRVRVAPTAPLDPVGWALCAVIACILTIDLFEGLSPPVDADSLAYHFATPKLFLASGRLAAQQIKLAMIEVRRSPWKLLYKPEKAELEHELLYEAARTFAMAVSDLRATSQTAERLLSNPRIETDPELQRRITQFLGTRIENYENAQQQLLDVLLSEKP